MKRRSMWVLAGGIIVMAVVFGWLAPHVGGRRMTTVAGDIAVLEAQGTAGRDEPNPTDADPSPATIREIETITGAVDGHELIGRLVDLDLKATGVTTQGVFWVGPRDNHVLVAPARTTRATRPAREGGHVAITGTIQEMPEAKERLSWGLTAPDLLQLTEQKIYIRADRITPE